MNPNLIAKHNELDALHRECDALLAKAEPTAEDITRMQALPTLIEAKEGEIRTIQALSDRVGTSKTFLNGNVGGSVSTMLTPRHAGATAREDQAEAFERLKNVRSQARYFSVVASVLGETRQHAQLKAFRFGMWMLASIKGNAKAKQYCTENGIPVASGGHTESINEDGGALVPPEFENDMIILREKFGLFRSFARYTPMSSDVKDRPRRTGGLTAYFVGPGADGTRSKAGWDRVKLVAKKVMCLALYESELAEDAVVDIGDTLFGEMAYAFSVTEDQCGFIGDGTSTYGGITGLTSKLKGLSGTIANIAGLVVAAGNTFDEFTLANHESVVGRLPQFADTPNCAWYCHRTYYFETMVRLMLASGGVTQAEVSAGARNPMFLGYPVRITQTMPKVDANSQIPVLFGDLALAAMFGDRRQTTIAVSEHAEFESDELLIRGTERFDINVHDVGNAHATAASRVPGPIVGLISAAS